MGHLWKTQCSGCEKPLTTLHGGQYCTTPGCGYASNLPVSKTGMSSPGKPIQDPALARENIMLERQVGYTPALPFTECKCGDEPLCICGSSSGSSVVTFVQLADEPHFPDCPLYGKIDLQHAPQCPLYEEPESVFPPNTPFAAPTAPTAPTALAGHSCKFCGRPIHNVGGMPTGYGWIHNDANDFLKCGKQVMPKATKLTGTCIHGNPMAGGCQVCDGASDIAFETKLCIHGTPIGVAFGTCDSCKFTIS